MPSFEFCPSLVPSLELFEPVFQKLLYRFYQILFLGWGRGRLLIEIREKRLDLVCLCLC